MATQRRKKRPYESVSYSHPVFRPYTEALGQVALAWNGFHSAMALLFCTVMGGGIANQHLAVWHALKNDRAQRDIPQAAAKESFGFESDIGRKVFEEIRWLNGQATRIEDARDDALHSPLFGYARDGRDPPVVPMTGLGHIRAQKLLEADVKRGLLTEFRWCRDAALVLTDYIRDIDELLSFDPLRLYSWPDRPALPNRGQTKNDSRRRPRTRREEPQPPPQSSSL
ncbi:MAG TPA: hypothetical protein VGJ20_37410 [Xanthobacteraceae bacterium]